MANLSWHLKCTCKCWRLQQRNNLGRIYVIVYTSSPKEDLFWIGNYLQQTKQHATSSTRATSSTKKRKATIRARALELRTNVSNRINRIAKNLERQTLHPIC